MQRTAGESQSTRRRAKRTVYVHPLCRQSQLPSQIEIAKEQLLSTQQRR
jgi:hypothetical protein